jgi:peptide/nickel transport system ATP-binding protein
MTGTAPLLETRLSVSYPGHPGVLQDVELQIQPGEIVGLVGGSGSGKSSFALALLRLLHFRRGTASGQIRFRGQDLMLTGERDMRRLRGREIAYVPQSPGTSLNPALRIEQQMAEAWKAHRAGSREEMSRDVYRAIAQVGLPPEPGFLRRRPGEVSVGQAQRVLIAMAILHRPYLLIADEPTSSLDVLSQAGILELLSRLNRELGTAFLYISHDLHSVARFCHRVAILLEGRIVEFEDAGRLFERPSHPHTRELIAAIPALPAIRRAEWRELVETL